MDVFGEAVLSARKSAACYVPRDRSVTDTPDGVPRVVGTIVHLHAGVRLSNAAVHHVTKSVTRSIPSSRSARQSGGNNRREVEVAIFRMESRGGLQLPHAAWSIDDDLFARIYDPERRPFWTTVPTNDGRYNVFQLSNDRVFIYAIGYRFPHRLRSSRPPAELTTLSGVLYMPVLIGGAMCSLHGPCAPASRPRALREIRASFYRKLFLAFVLASIIPILIPPSRFAGILPIS
jgi:hypothetical protein